MIGSGNILAAGAVALAAWLGVGPPVGGFAAGYHADRVPHSHPEDPAPEPAPTEDPAPVVYLTFDDGPHPVYTPQVLDVLASYEVKATFFVVGDMVRRWPDAARQIVEAGHSIQSHAWNHDTLTTFSRKEFTRDMNRTQTELLYATKTQATCMRPPYGATNSRVEKWANELGLTVELWDAGGADWTGISAESIARRVLSRVAPGSVVLLHDGGGPRSPTVSALDIIIPALLEDGYRFGFLCRPNPLSVEPAVCAFSRAWPRVGTCGRYSQRGLQ
ncbi:MAG: polysaccharide deacetylase family protein [bacterium]|nr:polysaccharide deacetylase family protein [bacterium]MDE0601787.1 polysaccharide deacetylase family protein [bacterium]